MIRSSLSDYSDAYIHVKGTIKVPKTGTAAALNNRSKKLISKNSAPFINCISEINNTPIDDAYGVDVVMPMYNLQNMVIFIPKHQEIQGNAIEMNQL